MAEIRESVASPGLGHDPDWAALGLEPAWAAAFRSAAMARAPGLAHAYAQRWRSAYRAAGLDPGPPAWRARWPADHYAAVDYQTACAAAVQGLASIDPRLGGVARRLIASGAVKRRPGPACTRTRLFGPPAIRLDFDSSPAAAVTLAHELGHGVLMTDAAGRSRRAAALAVAETGAQLAERAASAALLGAFARPISAQIADDALAMLVRHPARDAFEVARREELQWPAIAARCAPGHDWAQTPAPKGAALEARPGAILAYGLSAALSFALWPRMRRERACAERVAAWFDLGPDADLRGLAAAVSADLADPALYWAAYDEAETMIRGLPP